MQKNIITTDSLFQRVVSILEQARSNVARSVNTNMVIAYWLIGREIVEEIQEGKERATYGERVIEGLSKRLNEKYRKGFSLANLKRFRQFYRVYSTRLIGSPLGIFSENELAPRQGANSINKEKGRQSGDELKIISKQYPVGTELQNTFNPNLSWSHYRALMRLKNCEARNFYEKEAEECSWSKKQLERQIHSSYYERIVSNKGKEELVSQTRERLKGDDISSISMLKSPLVLEFLGIPDSPSLHETQLEKAIITHLQSFLLELGKGFAFVSRQKRMRFENKDLFIDIVFYNCILKCYLLIDLKIGEISHKDVGQMDGYVRMFDDRFTADDDNPTVGLILCTEKNEAVAKYSVLNDKKQIFASKYMLYLPTEKELSEELKKERLLIEEYLKEKNSKKLLEK